jgi:competence protein ComEA
MVRLFAFIAPILVAAAAVAASAPSAPAGRASSVASAAHVATAVPEAGAEASAPVRSRSGRGALKGVANLNTADAATLELLPGIGEKKADRIITFRHGHTFKRVEDLSRVKGFGRKTLQRLRPHLSVAGPTSLSVEEERGE